MLESLDPEVRRARLVRRYYTRQGHLQGDCFYAGLCEPIEETERRIRETSDYMQHRIIGPVVLTVHEYETEDRAIPVLKPGNYSRVPSIAHWEAPGHILTNKQKRTFKRGVFHRSAENPDGPALRVWPHLATPNAGFPLPGHVLTGPKQGPGTKAWKKYGMEGYDW